MFDLPSWGLPAIAIIFGAGGPFGAVLLWLQARKKAPIDAATAQIANAVAISSSATGVVTMMEARLKSVDDRSNEQDKKIKSLELQVAHIDTVWSVWYDNLSNRWHIYRQEAKAPDAPIRRIE